MLNVEFMGGTVSNDTFDERMYKTLRLWHTGPLYAVYHPGPNTAQGNNGRLEVWVFQHARREHRVDIVGLSSDLDFWLPRALNPQGGCVLVGWEKRAIANAQATTGGSVVFQLEPEIVGDAFRIADVFSTLDEAFEDYQRSAARS